MSLGKQKILSQGTTAVVPDSGYFLPVAYTGTGGTQSISSLTFSPDMVWIKKRSSATSSDHSMQDTVRGFGSQGGAKIAYPNGQYAEATNADTYYFSSFDSKGFTMGGNTYYNGSGETYVAWCFRGGGSANTFNIDGTGYSTAAAAGLNTGSATVTAASVNTAAGFSIIQHSSISGFETVSHGLNSAPEFIISWSQDRADGMYCFHTNFYTGGGIGGVKLFSSDAYSGSTWWRAMSSSTFETGLYNAGQNMLSYVFHSVAGVQKLGSYTGNNPSAVTVSLDFTPSFVMIKNVTRASNWAVYDTARSPSNNRNKLLYFDLSDAEAVSGGNYIQINTNQFVTNGGGGDGSNRNGDTFIYWAMA